MVHGDMIEALHKPLLDLVNVWSQPRHDALDVADMLLGLNGE
jgi:hypothetical protein